MRLLAMRILGLAVSVCFMSGAGRAESWEQHMQMGQEAREAQNLSVAEKQFKAAMKETQKAPGKELQFAESLDGLAAVYRDQNKYAKTESLYQQSLGIKQRVLGAWDPSLAQTLDNLAAVLDSRRKHDQAEPLYKRARLIREQALVEHPDVYVDGVAKPVRVPK